MKYIKLQVVPGKAEEGSSSAGKMFLATCLLLYNRGRVSFCASYGAFDTPYFVLVFRSTVPRFSF